MRSLINLSLASCLLFLMGCTEENTHVTQIIGPSDWRGPEIRWLSPPESEVRGTVGLDAEVTDSSALSRIILFVNGVEHDTLFTSPCRFEIVTDSLPDGVHVCEIRAWDVFGNLGISPVLRINAMNSIAQGPRLLWVPDDFIAIQAAINAAQDFDTIRVRNGTYRESLNLFGKGVYLESVNGPISTFLDASLTNNAVLIPTGQIPVTIRGFNMSARGHIIRITAGGQLKFFNNIVMSDSADDHLITDFCGGLIQNNLFIGTRYGVQIGYFLGGFYNNMITGVDGAAFWNAAIYENPLEYGYNLFWDNNENYGNFAPGEGDIVANPRIDIVNGRLLDDSPAIDAGEPNILDNDSSRSDIGPFGGPYAY